MYNCMYRKQKRQLRSKQLRKERMGREAREAREEEGPAKQGRRVKTLQPWMQV